MSVPTAGPSLGLLAIRAADVTRALELYRAVGLSFVEEQHGGGARHFSGDLGGMLLEIYPGKSGSAPARAALQRVRCEL